MRNILTVLAAAAILGLCGQLVAAEAAAPATPAQSVSGVLVDQACAAGMMKTDAPEAAAKKHTKACAIKEACEQSGYAVISGKKLLKFDANGNKLAKAFLAKTDKASDIEVVVKGVEKGDEIAVTSIDAPAAK